ncbi:acyl-CoA dehydrogenase family protein [Paenarthrobacter sp. FR1]|uniref:acyl-CoA dehydrogenase family protein n=1 Tax=Paenarthrobacter sp. FR1 TaxID=3439548 RepID=UPI003DA6462B
MRREPAPEMAPCSNEDYQQLAARYRPLFRAIADGAVARETNRTPLHGPLRELAAAGFTALRVPRRHGGGGVSARHFFRLLVELAAAESNLAQALRAHICFVEDRLYFEDETWLKRVAEGQLVGNAVAASSGASGGGPTTLSPQGGKFILNGQKSYTTGSFYANWIQTKAEMPDGRSVTVMVDANAAGVEVHDDWDGFGQRLTASGTTDFNGVQVAEADLLPEEENLPFAAALHQLVHVATLAGISQRISEDVATEVRGRLRGLSEGTSPRLRTDPQIQQLVGELSASAFVAEAAALRVAGLLNEALRTQERGNARGFRSLVTQMGIASYQSQIIVTKLTQDSATTMFTALGASSVRQDLQLDRHWRNARVLSSHSPVVYKSRVVGDWEINGSIPTNLAARR